MKKYLLIILLVCSPLYALLSQDQQASADCSLPSDFITSTNKDGTVAKRNDANEIILEENGNIILEVPEGDNTYVWEKEGDPSFTSTSNQIDINETGTYKLKVYKSLEEQNLVKNPSFEENLIYSDNLRRFVGADVNLGSHYTQKGTDRRNSGPTAMHPEGTFAIAKLARDYHRYFWCSPRTGERFMPINGNANKSKPLVWYQNNIPVEKNKSYVFIMWATSLDHNNRARLNFTFNGEAKFEKPINLSERTCKWQQFYILWYSGNNTTVNLAFTNANFSRGGNDFGIDDLFFGIPCEIERKIKIVAGSKVGIKNLTLCPGETKSFDTFGKTDPRATVKWYKGDETTPFHEGGVVSFTHDIDLSTISGDEVTKYRVESTVKGIPAEETFEVRYVKPQLELPTDILTCNLSNTITPAIDLSNDENDDQLRYEWSFNNTIIPTNNDINNIDAKESGVYTLKTNRYGCPATDDITVDIVKDFGVYLGKDTILCDATEFELKSNITHPEATHEWTKFGDPTILSTDNKFKVTEDGRYVLLAKLLNHCVTVGSINVSFSNTPDVTFANDFEFCDYDAVKTIKPDQAEDTKLTYAWTLVEDPTFTSSDYEINVTQSGHYQLTVNDRTCTNTAVANVIIADEIKLKTPTALDLCKGSTVDIANLETFAFDRVEWYNTADLTTIISTENVLTVDKAGTYKIIGYKNAGSKTCEQASETTVSIRDLPTVTFAQAKYTFCPSDKPKVIRPIEDKVAGYTYTWKEAGGSIQINTFELTDPITGNYELIVENEYNCQAKGLVQVEIYPRIQVTLGNDIFKCEDESATIKNTATQAYDIIKWTKASDPTFSASTEELTVSETDTYTLTVTKNGCSNSDDITFTKVLKPVFSFDSDVKFCHEDAKIITPSGDPALHQYSWNKKDDATVLGTNHSLDVTTTGTGTYELTMTENLIGCNITHEINVDIIDEIKINLGADISDCEGDKAILKNTETTTYDKLEWRSLSDGNIVGTDTELTVETSDNYELTVFNNGCSKKATINVTFKSNPDFFLADSKHFCHEDTKTVKIIGLSTFDYKWKNTADDNTVIGTDKEIAVTEAGNYKVTAFRKDDVRCQFSDNIAVTITEEIPVDLGNSQTICADATADFVNANGQDPTVFTYTWAKNQEDNIISSNADGTLTGVNEAGTYFLTLEKEGCKNNGQVDLIVNELPIVTLTDITFCNDIVTKVIHPNENENPNYTYEWTRNNDATFTATGYELTVTDSDQYNLTVSNKTTNCAQQPVTINVTINPTVLVKLSTDQEVCEGTTITLENTESFTADSQKWFYGTDLDNEIATDPTHIATVSGLYTLVVTKNGCTAMASTNVLFKAIPTFTVPAKSYFCNDENVKNISITTGSDDYEYTWTDNTGKELRKGKDFNPSTSGDYTVIATYNGCISKKNANVAIAEPIDFILGGDEKVCAGQNATISVTSSSDLSYKWIDEDGLTGLVTNKVMTTNKASIYTFTATLNDFDKTCTVVHSKELKISPNPDARIIDNSGLFCNNDYQVLRPEKNQDPESSYKWIHEDEEGNETVYSYEYEAHIKNKAGKYSLIVERDGCPSIPSNEVNMKFIANSSYFDQKNVNFCDDGILDIKNVRANGELYEFPSNNATFTWYKEGLENVELSNTNILPANKITSGNYIAKVKLRFTANNSTGKIGEVCYNSSVTYQVNIDKMPDLSAVWETDNTLCQGDSWEIKLPKENNNTYQWYNSDGKNLGITNGITLNKADSYRVDITSGICQTSLAAKLNILQYPIFDLGPERIELCNQNELVLNATNFNDDITKYIWQDGSTNPTFTVSKQDEETLYHVSAANGKCESEDEITVLLKTCNSDLKLPNVFTPNGDGSNDTFGPYGFDGIENYSIKVYNRWGALMWETNNIEERWNGTKDGKLCPKGVYFWSIKLKYTHPKIESNLEDYTNRAGSVTLQY